MREQNATENDELTTLPVSSRSIAPWWHTILLVVPLLAFSILGSLKPEQQAFGQHHVLQYMLTLAWEWVLAALVLWGIHMRKTPLRQLLGVRRPGLRAWRD